MMPSVAMVKFIKTKVIFGYHGKDVPNKGSSNSDYKIKSYSSSNSSTKMGKTKKWEKKILSYVTGQRGDYKSGQVLGITNRGNRDYK